MVHLKPLKKGGIEDATGAYTNIITWACDAASFLERAKTIAATMDLYVVETEGEEPLAQRFGDSVLREELEACVPEPKIIPMQSYTAHSISIRMMTLKKSLPSLRSQELLL